MTDELFSWFKQYAAVSERIADRKKSQDFLDAICEHWALRYAEREGTYGGFSRVYNEQYVQLRQYCTVMGYGLGYSVNIKVEGIVTSG
jgi:hypothetical protein